MFQAKEEAEGPKVENMSDRLRKKRNRTKRRTATPGYQKDSETPTTGDPASPGQRLKIKYVGSQRSLVRMIGSYAPITPENRAYFEMFDNAGGVGGNAIMSRASSFIKGNLDHVRQHVDQVKYSVVPSLADLGQLVWDDFKFTEDDEDDETEEGQQSAEKMQPDDTDEEPGITFTVQAVPDKPTTSKASADEPSSTSSEEAGAAAGTSGED